MTAEHRATVIVPVRNHAATLEELLRRLIASLDQAYPDFEVLVVDDGSVDSSWSVISGIVRGDRRVKAVRIVSGRGQAAAIAFAMPYVTGDLVAFLDADLEYWPEDVPLILDALADGADVAAGVRPKQEGRAIGRRLMTAAHARLTKGQVTARFQDPGSGLKGFRLDFYRRAFRSDHLKDGMLHLFVFATSARRIDNVPIRWQPSRAPSSYDLSTLALMGAEQLMLSSRRLPTWLMSTGLAGVGASIVAILGPGGRRRALPALAVGVAGASAASSAVTASLLTTALRSGAPPYLVDQLGDVDRTSEHG